MNGPSCAGESRSEVRAGSMRLFLVRHGEALPKTADPLQPLSPEGKRCAVLAADALLRAGARPVALLHSAGVALALRWLWRSGERGEEIAIGPAAVEVRRGAGAVFSAHPHWVRMGVDGDDGRVTLSSSGRWVEVGAFLGPAERSQLARCLKEFLAAAAQGGGRNR